MGWPGELGAGGRSAVKVLAEGRLKEMALGLERFRQHRSGATIFPHAQYVSVIWESYLPYNFATNSAGVMNDTP